MVIDVVLNQDHNRILKNISRFPLESRHRSQTKIERRSPQKYTLNQRRDLKLTNKRTISEFRGYKINENDSSIKHTFHLDYQDFLNKTVLERQSKKDILGK